MKKPILIAAMAAAGASLFLTGTWYGRQAVSAAGTQSVRRVLYYVDPMNPTHTSDRPGLAPCGMKLQPVYEGTETASDATKARDTSAPGGVHIAAEKQQLIGVRVSPVEKFTGTHTVRAFGRVVPDERRVHRLNAGAEGTVRELSEVTPGSLVKKDQWLATFSAPDTRTTIQGFLTALDVVDRQTASGANSPAQLAIVNENARLAADRLQNMGISPVQLDEIRKTRTVPSALRILAPADGYIIAQTVTPGLRFEKGSEWYRVADLTHVWVMVDVPIADGASIPAGTAVEVCIAGQQKALPARVSDSLPQVDPVSRTLRVRLEVDNPGIVLRPEMYVDVKLPVLAPSAVAVSADAVLSSGTASTVFIEQDNGSFAPRAVETGRHLGDQVEILSGLEPGERIVTSGHFLIDSEARMKLAAGAASTPALTSTHSSESN